MRRVPPRERRIIGGTGGLLPSGPAAASTAAADTPLTILGASNLLQWCRADLGVTIGVGFTWADQSGHAADYANAVAAAGPSLTSADATLNNQSTLTFNGTTQSCDAPLALPVPGTTPVFIWWVLKQNGWTSTRAIFGDTAGSRHFIFQQTASPGIGMADTTQVNNNTAGTIGSWFRGRAQFTSSTSDYLKIGATTVTGASAGNFVGGGTRRIATNQTGTGFTSVSLAEVLFYTGTPSAQQLSDLDTYCTNRYGAGLV
jgi:hypothetical protein